MKERRKTPRLEGENEFTINIISEEKSLPEEDIFYNSKDISIYGAKIQSNVPLPVDAVIKIDITLNDLQQKITTTGKVKWNKFIIENGYYEAGMEFADTSSEAIQKLYERTYKDDAFISEEGWSNLQEFNKYEISQKGDIFIPKEEWSKLQELNKYEISQEGDTFIPKEEWSKLQGINTEEVFIAKQIKSVIETGNADMKNCRYCFREIKSDAVKCEYCGRALSGERTDRKVFI